MASLPPSAWAFGHAYPTSSPLFSSTRTSLMPRRSSPANQNPGEEQPPADPMKLAFSKAEAYKKAKEEGRIPESKLPPSTSDGDDEAGVDSSLPEVSPAIKLAMDRAKEYKKNKGVQGMDSGQENIKLPNSKRGIEEKNTIEKVGLKVSSVDFLGLDFAEKKTYKGRPPGLSPVVEPLVVGDMPEVELIIGDASKFGGATPSVSMDQDENDDNMALYKPKVSTWGVFPRPSNISKTFGGGRNIQPGELLETVEDKEAKVKRTKELIGAYKSKMGLTYDAKTKAECETALKEGDRLMDLGRLREALPFYEKIMKDMVFQSELHGQAALQWSICQDSLSSILGFKTGNLVDLRSTRQNEARAMYEKLQSHPNAQVSKRAKQFAFSFQAMEMMKVTSSSILRKTGYETYFDAFVDSEDNFTATREERDESVMSQGLPYIVFLSSPFLFILFLVTRKSFGL